MAALASVERPDSVDLVLRAALWPPVIPPCGTDRLVLFRLELQAARRAGAPFELAWPVARGRAFGDLATAGAASRKEYWAFCAAITATRVEWARAYHRRGERLAIVDRLLAALIVEESDLVDSPDPGDD